MGIVEERIYSALGVKGVEDIQPEQILVLKGFYNAIKEDGASVEEIFAPPVQANGETAAPVRGTNAVKEKLAQKAAKPSPSPTVPAQETVSETVSDDVAEPCPRCGKTDECTCPMEELEAHAKGDGTLGLDVPATTTGSTGAFE